MRLSLLFRFVAASGHDEPIAPHHVHQAQAAALLRLLLLASSTVLNCIVAKPRKSSLPFQILQYM